MRRTLIAASLMLAPACHGRAVGPPDLFPVTTAWTAALGDSIEGPLATDGARLFVATRDGTVRAFDLASGAVAWEVEGRPGVIGWGPGLLALREAGGTVWGMEPDTGHARWKVDSGVAGTVPPVVAAGRVLVAGAGLADLDAATGAARWSLPEPASTSPPLAWKTWVLVGEADGTLRCRDAATGASLWTFATGGPVLATPVVDDRQRILIGTSDRRFLALRLKDGTQRWRWKVGADVQAQAALLEDKVLFGSHDDVLYALKRGSGNMVWRASLPSRPLGGPVLAGTAVLIACFENEVVGFDGRTGRKLGSLHTSAEIRTPPLIVGERLYLGLRDRTVVALQLPGPPSPDAPVASPGPPASPSAPPTPSPVP